jgi:hypothetical protein
MTQIDIYDLLTPDDLTSVNFRTMTVEEIAQTLGARLGLEFKFNGFFNEYQAKVKDTTLSVKLSCYSADQTPFISCGEWNKKTMSGCGSPCDSLAAAYAFLNRAKERARE